LHDVKLIIKGKSQPKGVKKKEKGGANEAGKGWDYVGVQKGGAHVVEEE